MGNYEIAVLAGWAIDIWALCSVLFSASAKFSALGKSKWRWFLIELTAFIPYFGIIAVLLYVFRVRVHFPSRPRNPGRTIPTFTETGGGNRASTPPVSLSRGQAPKTADSSERPRADPGAPRYPGAAQAQDPLAVPLAGASGVQLGSGNVQYNYFNDNPARTGSDGTRPVPASGASGPSSRGHAFISYVREDSAEVDALQKTLEEAGIPVWRDTSSLWPGENWSAKIRTAINSDALVFIACFSTRSAARQRSYQNEELALAIDELRQRRPDDPWLIPVRLDDCDVPDFDLGAGQTLASINRADLFGPNRNQATRRIVEAVQRLLR